MSQGTQQFSCECGKQFSNRNELEKHRKNCATAQTRGSAGNAQRGSGGQQVRTAGGAGMGSNDSTDE
jgi:hypothetical protein